MADNAFPRPGVPRPFAPPPGGMQPMGMPFGTPSPMIAPRPEAPESEFSDPVALIEAINKLKSGMGRPPEPIYRVGYKPPKRPVVADILLTGRKLHEGDRAWRMLVNTMLKWTRQQLTGAFPEDILARQLGFQEEYISSALSDERNLIISKGAALRPSFRKLHTSNEDRGYAQKLEDAAMWLREQEQLRHVIRGNRPLELDEWSMFTDMGMYASRDTFSPLMSECPVDMRLIDPRQVHGIWNGTELERVYRVYWSTYRQIAQSYGDLSDANRKKIEDQCGKVEDDMQFEVIEYWDTWWRCVCIGDIPVLDVTAHKYGEVPWTIQYGGGGEPMFTSDEWGSMYEPVSNNWVKTQADVSGRMYKATPYLFYRIRTHEIFEAVMARAITALKKEVNPPTIRYRSVDAADKEMPDLDSGAGAQNDAMLGDERIEPFPTVTGRSFDLVLGGLQQDIQRSAPPAAAYGQIDKSNVTSIAQAGANDAGQHLLFPSTKAWEMALQQKYPRIFRLLGNMSHLSTYGTGKKRPIVIPARRSRGKQGGPPAYEFDREIITRVGSDIRVTFTKVDSRDWAPLFAAGSTAVDKGFALRAEIRQVAFGDYDWDSFIEEWQEENAIFQANQLPEFQKLNIASEIMAQIEENEGRPEVQRNYIKMLSMWEKIINPPQQPQQPGMGGQPPMGQPQPQQGGGGPLPPGPGSVSVGGPGGVSYPAMGQGPGSQGAPVGRPY